MMQATPDSKPTGAGCPWAQRPVANKFYPDIMVPLELVPSFDIPAASNQSIWTDVYIPKSAPPGVYGAPSWSNNPDDWEAARAALAHIIDGQ